MNRNAVYKRIKQLAKAGLSEAVHPHTLRHTAITAALDAGGLRRTSKAA